MSAPLVIVSSMESVDAKCTVRFDVCPGVGARSGDDKARALKSLAAVGFRL